MKNFIRLITLAIMLGVSAPTQANFAIFQTASSINQFQTLKVGAGGSISNIDIQCDQGVGQCNNTGTTTKAIRTDTYGGYVYNPSAANPGNAGGTGVWQQVLTASSFPVTAGTPYLPSHYAAVYEIRIAPSNTSVLYMEENGLVYTSSNKGASWTQTSFSQTSTNGNDQITELFGPYIAIDPANSNNAIVGTASSGAFYTMNGGANWTQISGLCTPSTPSGAGQGGGYLIAFDPSTTSGGSTSGVYISCYGTGLYHSSTGVNGTFSAVTGTPTTHIKLLVDATGVVYLIDNSGNTKGVINKCTSCASSPSWTTVTTGLTSGHVRALAIDPNTTHMLAVDDVGETSYYNGSSWSATQTNPTVVSSDIPWIQNGGKVGTTFDGSQIVFDPAQSNVVFYSEGIGVSYGTPSSGSTMTWNDISSGIEQLVSTWIVSPPGGNPVITFFDRPAFTITNPNVYPSDYGSAHASSSLNEGFSVDWASTNGSFIALLAQNFIDSTDVSGYSTVGGGAPANWTVNFAGYSSITDFAVNGGSYRGGSIASSSPTCVVIAVGNGAANAATAHGGLWQWNGTTWSSPTVSGFTTSTNPGWGASLTYTREILAADRVDATTVYAYNQGTSGGAIAGLYKTTNCSTWTRVFTGNISTGDGFNAQMRSVPGVSGDLFFTSGRQSPDSSTQPFYQSTDHGATWNAVSNVTDVSSFGFGAHKPSESTAAIYCYCRVSGTLGMWRGTNATAGVYGTWTQLAPSDGAFPGGSLDQVVAVEGDNNTYGVVYVCFIGSGCKWGTFP